jgi:hypothetical protein
MIVAPRTVFLSYASEQRLLAESVALSLRGRGFEVFLDRDNLGVGGAFDAAIEAAVFSSDAFVFLVSPASVTAGRYTLTELVYARQKWPAASGRVLPVLAESTAFDTIPAYLKSVTILEPQGNPAAEVGAAVARLLGSAPPATIAQWEATDEKRHTPARLLLVGLLASLTVGVPFIAWQSDMPLRELVDWGIRRVVQQKPVETPEYRNPDLIEAKVRPSQAVPHRPSEQTERLRYVLLEGAGAVAASIAEISARLELGREIIEKWDRTTTLLEAYSVAVAKHGITCDEQAKRRDAYAEKGATEFVLRESQRVVEECLAESLRGRESMLFFESRMREIQIEMDKIAREVEGLRDEQVALKRQTYSYKMEKIAMEMADRLNASKL